MDSFDAPGPGQPPGFCILKLVLKDAVEKIFDGEVLSDESSLEFYSRDASLFKIKPELAVKPRTRAALKALVKFVSAHRAAGDKDISISARSGGTDMSGGPLGESIIVDFTAHLNKLTRLDERSATVEPGLYYRDFEKEADKLGVMLPSYPASKSICAMGGIVANNSGGEKTLFYGKTEKYLKRVKMILADGEEYSFGPLGKAELEARCAENNFEGEIYRKIRSLIFDNLETIEEAKPKVSKNSAGYALWNVWDGEYFNLAKLFCGAQGTLGLMTEAELELVPKKKYSRLLVAFLKSQAPVSEFVRRALAYGPESLESFDDNTLKIAVKFFFDIVRAMKVRNFLKLAIQFLPEFFMVLRGGTPKLILLTELADDDEAKLDERMVRLREDLKKLPVRLRTVKTSSEGDKYWAIRRESFNLLRKRIRNRQTAPFIDDFIVRPEYLSDFLPRLREILEPYSGKLVYTLAGHVGDGNFHIIPLADLKDPEIKKIIPELMEKVYDLVAEFHGSITAEHNDGLIRSPYLSKMYGEKVIALFEETKRIFDPAGIFNPGKKTNASVSYAMSRLRTE